jgi:serine/threonine protein phosphatase PrpC
MVATVTGYSMRAQTYSDMAAAQFSGNTASLLTRPDLRLFAVAQAIGDGSNGTWVADTIISQIGKLSGSKPTNAQVMAQLNTAHERISAANLASASSAHGVVAALTFDEAHAFGMWVGNCRIYRLRSDMLTLLTDDHDVASALAARDGRQISARNDPMKRVLTRAIGSKSPVEPDRFLDRFQSGDRYLITGSGLARALPDDDIARQLGRGAPREAADRLYGLAMSRGAVPNFGIIVIDAPQAD